MTFYECVHEVISLWYFAVLSCNAGTASGWIQLKKKEQISLCFLIAFSMPDKFFAVPIFCQSHQAKKKNEILILKLFFISSFRFNKNKLNNLLVSSLK
jgi:hypothetical protein